MATEPIIQGAILLLTFVMFWALKYLSQQGLTKFRTKHRATLQTQRQLIQASRLLARARATPKKSQSQSLAKTALTEADDVIAISPDDAAGHIVRALSLDLLGHHTAALKSFDTALTYPRLKSLSVGERADALVKRAEMKVAVNRRRRNDSAIEDLEEATRLAAGTDTARIFRLLGECYEFKGLKEKAQWAFNEALKAQ
ncbi:Tetratricopeptide repeat (TPR)-like superfamily protein [Raphanus sativus]|uniref:Uncharacterized protein LOC108828353 n=1 Tax=Raphanus sativus TaxID=3726 RepID=A0A6J0LDD9_RAPSA|nr:uncharacterized protein LOC108828353 [Raphanus sativus]KAJ4878635.1 Tetratricopeptide repeat (TPR)-like superfamily protein [Raphanus sativus]